MRPLAFFRKAWVRARALWRLARTERSAPRQIGLAVAVGAFCGCTPAVGFHGVVAIAAATLFRLNRMWAWIGSRVSNFLILPFIVIAEVQLSHRLRTGSYVELTRDDVLDKAGSLLVDWCVGCLLVGPVIALVAGAAAYAAVAFKRTRAARRPPSSGSTQSD